MTRVSEHRQASVVVVEAMFAAQQAGRLDAMLTLVHRDVVWEPITRPGRSVYFGHAGTLELLDDLKRSTGPFRIDFESFTELADGRVLAVGRTIAISADGEESQAPFECVLTVTDGQVIKLESGDSASTS